MRLNFIGILASIIVVASCTSNTCMISGTVSDAILQKGDVVVTYNMEEQLELKDGHFSVSTDRRDTSAVHFSIRSSESPSVEFVVVPDSKTVKVLVNEDGPVFSGSKLTEDLYVLQNSMLTLFMESNARAMASDDEDVAQAIMKEMHAKMKQLAKDQWDKHPVADALGLQAASMYLREASNKEVIQFIDAAPEGVMNYPQIKQIYEYILDQVDEEYWLYILDTDGIIHKHPGGLDEYIGKGKYTLVDFWGIGCAPCRKEMPLINRIHEEYKDKGLVVVGVLVDANKKELQPLVSELGIRFDQVIDAGQVFADRYHVKFTPYHILFGPDGQVIQSDIDSDALLDTVRKYHLSH